MWMIEYFCEIDLKDVETITPDNLQEHITILDLQFMRDKKIFNFVQRFYDNGRWYHRYFVNSKASAYTHVKERNSQESWKYFYAYLKTKNIQIIGPIIQETNFDELKKGIKYYF